MEATPDVGVKDKRGVHNEAWRVHCNFSSLAASGQLDDSKRSRGRLSKKRLNKGWLSSLSVSDQ